MERSHLRQSRDDHPHVFDPLSRQVTKLAQLLRDERFTSLADSSQALAARLKRTGNTNLAPLAARLGIAAKQANATLCVEALVALADTADRLLAPGRHRRAA